MSQCLSIAVERSRQGSAFFNSRSFNELTRVWHKVICAVANLQLLSQSTLHRASTVTVVIVYLQVVFIAEPTTAKFDTDRSSLGIIFDASDADLTTFNKYVNKYV